MQYCPVAAGLCRGCPLSLTLYITYMDRFSRDSKGSIEFPVWWPLYYFFALCGGWKLAGFSKCWSAYAGSAKWLTAELALPKMRPWVSAWKGWSSFSRLVRSSPSHVGVQTSWSPLSRGFWVCLGVSSPLMLPRKAPKGGAQEASEQDVRITSCCSFFSKKRGMALLQDPSGCQNSSISSVSGFM